MVSFYPCNSSGMEATLVLLLKKVVLTGKSTKVHRLWMQYNLASKVARASTDWGPCPAGPHTLWCPTLLSHCPVHITEGRGLCPEQFHRHTNEGILYSFKRSLPLYATTEILFNTSKSINEDTKEKNPDTR